MNIAVFASGNGSNFSALARAVRRGAIKARLRLLVCDNPAAFVLKRALKEKVPAVIICRHDFFSRDAFESAIVDHLKKEKIELIVLAGFMRILSASFIRRYPGRIINIHPSLLPAFKGTQGIQDAFEYGVKVTGVTVHFVDEHVDHGPIILQQAVPITERDTLESLERKIHRTEHTLYPQALKLIVHSKVRITDRKVKVGR